MKAFLVVLCAAAVAFAEPPAYGAPSFLSGGGSFGGFSGNSGGGSSGGYSGGSAAAQGPQVFRHVYVHSAPDEAVDSQSRVIRVPGGNDKHVNIIFVKTPSSSSQQQTEVILPEQDQQKTLVYVLLKKGENNADIRVRAPPARGPTKPEVFFIRYGNQQQGASSSGGISDGGNTGGSRPVYGAPAF